MRILQLRFKNLNSLVGEWEIDLTHPAFVLDGIFAITGSTGAGKSTILDAICLALYGRTPRLNKVNKSVNEIMSRQTSDCFAEVTFETQNGRYRCHWSQHRARKKPDGDLQVPKHEIADANSGEIFESKTRGVVEQIEFATGMDFERFTRSMLLAQGGFAVFLQAAPSDRGPILEQITGTAIYGQISIRVHERHIEERKKLDILQAALAGMNLLNSEDEQQLNINLQQKIQSDFEFNQQIVQKNQAIVWLEGIVKLEETLKQLEQQKEALQIKLDEFAPDQERLKLAHLALELDGDYAALTSLRREQKTNQTDLTNSLESIPLLAADVKLLEAAMNGVAGKLDTKKLEQIEALPTIRKARELDLKITEKDAPIKLAFDSIKERMQSIDKLRLKQENDCTDLSIKHKDLEDLKQKIELTKADEALVEQLTGIQGRCDALHKLHAQQKDKLEEINTAKNQLQKASSLWQALSENLDKRRSGLELIQVELNEKQTAFNHMLEGKELADWHNNQLLFIRQNEYLAKAIEAIQSKLKSKQFLVELNERETSLHVKESSLKNQLNHQIEKQVSLKKEMEYLEIQMTLLKRIESLENERHQLKDGDPCPLCGAEDHPFAKGNVPHPNVTLESLSQIRGNLKSVTDAISDLNVELARIGKDFEQVASDQKEHIGNIDTTNRQIDQECLKLSPAVTFNAETPDLEIKLKKLQDENQQALQQAEKIVKDAEINEKALIMQRESLESAKEFVIKTNLEFQAAKHQKDSFDQLLERLKQELNELCHQQENSLLILQKDVQVFDITIQSIDNLNLLQEQLIARRDQWILHQKQKLDLEQKIAVLDKQTSQQTEQIQTSDNERNKQQQLLENLQREQGALKCDRKALFEDKNPDIEETLLSSAIDSINSELNTARQKWMDANQALSQLKSKIETLEKSIAARNIQLKSLEACFLVRLKESNFCDEEIFKAASLAEYERKNLAQRAQILADEKTELNSKERENTQFLAIERQKQLTDEPIEKLKEATETLMASQRELQQEIGGIRQTLKDNEDLKQKHQHQAESIAAQKRECTRWNLLHDLIGSADGKKYRNFAQGMTFEMMVGHANGQLQKMTDRYLLIRNDAHPLELSIIDNYQAGEIRSTKNLSGGEGFIVSLSLALGLSKMASKNVRVDSLFLDEGFGTLDEEALETALETLAGLHQDGKLIGVISHVQALKERISTQIQITSKTGGRSIISGPGCRAAARL